MISNTPQVNSPSFQAKYKYVNFLTYIKKTTESNNICSSDVFMPRIGKAKSIHSDGVGPCVTVCINGDEAQMIHLRPMDMTEENKNGISSILKHMCEKGNIKNCLILGGDEHLSKEMYDGILKIADNINELKNKITAICGHRDSGCCTNVHYDNKTETYLLNASQVGDRNFKNNLIKSKDDLNNFYTVKRFANGDEVSFQH